MKLKSVRKKLRQVGKALKSLLSTCIKGSTEGDKKVHTKSKQFSGGGSIVARESADSTSTQQCRSADEPNPQQEFRGKPAVEECFQILVASEISGPTRCIHSPHKKSHSMACLNYVGLTPTPKSSSVTISSSVPSLPSEGTGDIGKERLQMLSVSETSRPSTRRIHSQRRKSHSIAACMNYVGLNPSPISSSVTISSSVPSLPSEGGNHTSWTGNSCSSKVSIQSRLLHKLFHITRKSKLNFIAIILSHLLPSLPPSLHPLILHSQFSSLPVKVLWGSIPLPCQQSVPPPKSRGLSFHWTTLSWHTSSLGLLPSPT